MNWLADAIFSKGGLILAALAAFIVLERLYPVAAWVGGLWRLARNFGLAAFNIVLSPLVVVPLTQIAAAHSWHWRPEVWSGWPGLGLDLLLLDLWIYWWHRANHEIRYLWRFHEIHHLDETLDASTALRFHFVEVLLSALARAAVIVILDVPIVSVLVFEAMIALAAIFHHSNVRLPERLERLLSYVVVTPSIHWVHHHKVWRDTDSNYATVLSAWDRLFGSRSWTARTPDLPIGVEGKSDKPFTALVADPLRPQ